MSDAGPPPGAGLEVENLSVIAPGRQAAARRVAAHETIMDLTGGCGTRLGPGGIGLSGGATQRLGLARAFYGDPTPLVLDEPSSNLDAAGREAVRGAKAERRLVVIVAHRPARIAQCDLLLILDGGVRGAFGPREEVRRGASTWDHPLVAGVRDHGPM